MATKGIKISAYAHGLLEQIQDAGRKASKTGSKPTQADIVDPLIEKAHERVMRSLKTSTSTRSVG